MDVTRWWFESLDQARRLQGQALDRIGLGPRESPYGIVFSRIGVRLRCYGTHGPGSPVLVIVPAPIKGPYIWDLAPERSVVRQARQRGFAVYLLEWTQPEGQEIPLGLEEYVASMMDQCIGAALEHSRAEQVILAGHSLGGTLAAIYSAYRPERIGRLILIEAPLHFAEATGAFRPFLDMDLPTDAVFPRSGPIAGSLLGLISARAAPGTFHVHRYLDFLASLASRENLKTHWRVERWALDELPLPRKLFDDVVAQLYREDRFMRGELAIGTERLDPRAIRAPLFAVYEPSSSIVPPESVIAFCEAMGSQNRELMPYLGDTGTALKHVGALVGTGAHRHVWPRIFDWLN